MTSEQGGVLSLLAEFFEAESLPCEGERARCPHHDDEGMALTVAETTDGIHVECSLGCSREAIAGSIARSEWGLDHPKKLVPLVGSILVGSPATSSQLTARTLPELLALPPPAWLLEGLLPACGLTVLAGEPGSGKSLLALDWSLRMAHGVARWHERTLQPGSVLYLAGEGLRSLAARARAWLAAHPSETVQHELVVADLPNLALAAGLAMLRHAVDVYRPVLLVVDTLGLAVLGVDENDARSMGPAMHALGTLRDGGCAILALHHLAKDAGNGGRSLQGRVRGSGAIAAAADAVLVVERGTASGVVLRVGKMRDGEPARPVRLTLAPITLEDGSNGVHLVARDRDDAEPEPDPQAELAAAAESAREALAGLGGSASRIDTIARAMGGRLATSRAAVHHAIDIGLIVQQGTCRRPAYVVADGPRADQRPTPSPSATSR